MSILKTEYMTPEEIEFHEMVEGIKEKKLEAVTVQMTEEERIFAKQVVTLGRL